MILEQTKKKPYWVCFHSQLSLSKYFFIQNFRVILSFLVFQVFRRSQSMQTLLNVATC
uniref:Uncharacterized protein n=1 Tax=Anguilla anguilla TaxID=7936 RepID=A0A0E9XU67_ANGAN